MKTKYLFVRLYGSKRRCIRNLSIWIISKWEKGEFQSPTLRAIMNRYHDVDIGMYSHGACFKPYQFGRFTKIGRYCSFAMTSRVLNRNHPMDFPSMHAYFFNPVLGYVNEDKVDFAPITIGSDVWFGYNAIIMPSVKNIGHGAVIGAGAVVSKDVPPYAVLVGCPARIVHYRFPDDIINRLLESKWWEYPVEKLPLELMNSSDIEGFLQTVEDLMKD